MQTISDIHRIFPSKTEGDELRLEKTYLRIIQSIEIDNNNHNEQ